MPVKTVTIQVTALTDAANRNIAATGAYFEKLRQANPVELSVKFDRLQAIAEAKILAKELSQTVHDTVKLDASKGGFLSGLLGAAGAGGKGGSGLLGQLGKLFPTGGSAAGASGMLGLGVGAVPAAGALLVEVTGLVPGLAAATLGVGAFGLLAMPTFQHVTQAISGAYNANQKFSEAALNVDIALKTSHADLVLYNTALAKMPPNLASAARLLGNQSVTWEGLSAAQRNNVVALSQNKAALTSLLPAQKTALTQLLASKTLWDNLTPAQQKLTMGFQNLGTTYSKMVTAMQPDVLKILNSGLKIATGLMPALLPLAKAGGDALSGLADPLPKFLQLSTTTRHDVKTPHGMTEGFTKTLTPFGGLVKQMTALAGPAITAIGDGLGRLAAALGKLLTIMSKKDVVHSINIAFDILSGTISFIGYVIQRIMLRWDQWTAVVDQSRHKISQALDLMRAAFEVTRAWIEKNFVQVIVRFFTSTLPTAFDLWKESVRLVFDVIKTKALDTVLGITVAFGHLPGPLGAPFRAASASIRGELAKIQGDAANAAANINADWDKLHGKTVTLHFAFAGFPGQPPPGLAAGWRVPGYGGGDRHPALLEGGEAVVPKHLTPALAPFLKAHGVPGFAAGGTVGNFVGQFPSAAQIGAGFGAVQNAFNSASAAWAAKAQGAMPATGGGPGVQRWAGVALQALAMLGLPSSALGTVLSQMQTESGGNMLAVNLTDSNAAIGIPSTGLMQVVSPTYAAYGAPRFGYPPPVANMVSENPLANIYAGLNYAIHRYGAGWQGVLGHGHGYDSGGQLLPGATLAINRTGRAESVLGSRAEALLEQLVGLVDELCGLQAQGNAVAAAAPATTGASLGAALGMGARSAAYRNLYP